MGSIAGQVGVLSSQRAHLSIEEVNKLVDSCREGKQLKREKRRRRGEREALRVGNEVKTK
jgi:hypothetical protein